MFLQKINKMKIIRNSLAIIIGIVLGSIVNMAIITVSGSIIPPPNGADVTTMEGLKLSLPLFEPKHFILPFLAHAFGTFSGALIAALIVANHKMKFAMAIGVFFLIGGIVNIYLLPSPTWFSILDLAGAYIPMAFIAGKFVVKKG